MAFIQIAISPHDLRHFITPADDLRLVGHAFGAILNWMAMRTKPITVDQLKECTGSIIADTHTSVKCLQETIDMHTNPSLCFREGGNIYEYTEYSRTHESWFPRYAEIVEHIVKSYGGVLVDILTDLNSTFKVIDCRCIGINRSGIHIAVQGRELIEFLQT